MFVVLLRFYSFKARTPEAPSINTKERRNLCNDERKENVFLFIRYRK